MKPSRLPSAALRVAVSGALTIAAALAPPAAAGGTSAAAIVNAPETAARRAAEGRRDGFIGHLH